MKWPPADSSFILRPSSFPSLDNRIMQQRNLLLFFVLTALILVTYMQFRGRLAPQAPQADPVAKKGEEKKRDPAAPVRLPAPLPVTADAKLLTMGEADPKSKFNLQVVLDPLGGGVRNVTLNKFRPSDEDGRPGEGKVLDLVPTDVNLHEPSYVLNHFAPSDKDWDA